MPALKSSASPDSANTIVQFRADPVFMAQLSTVAQRLHTSPGLLSRHWVAERLAEEIERDLSGIKEWLVPRFTEIEKKLKKECERGPAQILHLIPLSQMTTVRTAVLEPAAIRAYKSSLAPVERVEDRYTGRINEFGYYTEKRFASNENEINGYLQIFRHGQLESVRVLRTIESSAALYGRLIDDDLIRACWHYSGVLRELRIPLPIQIRVVFRGLNGYEIRTREPVNAPAKIQTNELVIEPITLTDWNDTLGAAQTARLVRPILDTLWQASGYDRSPSYQTTGDWRGALEPWD